MKKITIILPLGDQSESAINQQVADATTVYNDAVSQAHIELTSAINQLPTEVSVKLLEKIAETEHCLPDYQVINSGKRATIADVRSIPGVVLITADDQRKLFKGKSLNLPKQPDTIELPWTVQFIQNMALSPEGCVITYQPHINKNKNIGIKNFAKLQSGIIAKGGGELLYRDQFTKEGEISPKAWFATSRDAYCDQQIITGDVWRISTKTPIAGTVGKKFVHQINTVCLWLIELHKNCVIPENLQSAIDEFREKQNHLQDLQDNNPQQFLVEISETKFWSYCLETGLETLFRLIAVNQITGEKLLDGIYTRNKVTEPVDGRVGSAGYFSSSGSHLSANGAGNEWGNFGLGFSCTE